MTQFDAASSNTRPLSPQGKDWALRTIEADRVWKSIQRLLAANKTSLPETPRRPDLRLIINNLSQDHFEFSNPGAHSGEAQEKIPPQGEKSAVMVMLAGDTLARQYDNAQRLVAAYGLAERGLTHLFAECLRKNSLTGFVREAYGPAPFTEQAGKLSPLSWVNADGSKVELVPVVSGGVAYGVRPPANELAVRVVVPVRVKGSTTTAELMEGDGMVIAISQGKDGGFGTRPIVPSEARGFYGAHYNSLPVARIDMSGRAMSISLPGGEEFCSRRPRSSAKPPVLPG